MMRSTPVVIGNQRVRAQVARLLTKPVVLSCPLGNLLFGPGIGMFGLRIRARHEVRLLPHQNPGLARRQGERPPNTRNRLPVRARIVASLKRGAM